MSRWCRLGGFVPSTVLAPPYVVYDILGSRVFPAHNGTVYKTYFKHVHIYIYTFTHKHTLALIVIYLKRTKYK